MNNDSHAQESIFQKKYASALSLVSLAVLLHAADATSVATLVPAIVDDIGGVELISWAVALYEIGSIIAGAACGLLTMKYGHKTPMLVATFVFSAGCIISALASDMWVVLCGRIFQGLGGGGLIALSFIAVSVLFHKSLIPKALAVVSIVWGSSAFLGPLIGALFIEYANWRFAFGFFALMAFILAGLLQSTVRDTYSHRENRSTRFPVTRLALLSFGVISIAYAGVNVSSVKTPAFVIFGLLLLVCFLRIDSKHDVSRLLPRNPITLSNRVGAGLTMILCFTISTIAITVYGPFLVTKLHGMPLLIGGYIVACSAVGWSVAAVVISKMGEEKDKRMIILGMLTLTISIIGFVISVPHGPVWLIAVFAFVEGAGFGMAWGFILRLITSISDENETERISAAIPTVQRLGYAIGAAYIGIIANAAGIGKTSEVDNITNTAFWIFTSCLPFALLGLVAALKFIKDETVLKD